MTDNPEQTRATHVDTLTCLECGRHWLDVADRWRLYVTAVEPVELLLYCAGCAAREFDD